MPCPSLPFFFHTSISRSCLPFLICCLFIFFLQFFSFPTRLFLLYPSNSPPLPSPASPLLSHHSHFLPICNCVPFLSFPLNPLISSLPCHCPFIYLISAWLSSLLLLSSLSLSFPVSPIDPEHPLPFLNFPPAFPVSFLLLLFLLCLTTCLSCLSSSSRMSEFSEEPRFTIEQIDLLQRLRRTGMTKQEILHALDTLDRLDREHGDKFGRRTSSSSSSSSSYGVGGANSCTNNSASNTTTTSFNNNNTASATTTSSVSCNGSNSAINSGEGSAGDHSAAAASSTTSKISTATQTQFGSAGGLSPSPSNSYDTSPPPGPPPPSAILPSPVSLVALSQNGRDSLAATPNGKLSPPRYPVNSAAAARAFGFEATEEDLDIDDKVEELMRSVVSGQSESKI